LTELKNIYIDSSAKTPLIDLNFQTGELILSGKSIPENPAKVYQQLIDWVKEYSKTPRVITNLRLNFEYFNTTSVIWIAKAIKILSTIKNPDSTLIIHIYVSMDDIVSMEGEELRDAISPIIEIIEHPSLNVGIKLYGTGDNGEILKETMILI
jgi:hypothetical protein